MFRRKAPAGRVGAERSFVQFVLEPLYKIYSQVVGEPLLSRAPSPSLRLYRAVRCTTAAPHVEPGSCGPRRPALPFLSQAAGRMALRCCSAATRGSQPARRLRCRRAVLAVRHCAPGACVCAAAGGSQASTPRPLSTRWPCWASTSASRSTRRRVAVSRAADSAASAGPAAAPTSDRRLGRGRLHRPSEGRARCANRALFFPAPWCVLGRRTPSRCSRRRARASLARRRAWWTAWWRTCPPPKRPRPGRCSRTTRVSAAGGAAKAGLLGCVPTQRPCARMITSPERPWLPHRVRGVAAASAALFVTRRTVSGPSSCCC